MLTPLIFDEADFDELPAQRLRQNVQLTLDAVIRSSELKYFSLYARDENTMRCDSAVLRRQPLKEHLLQSARYIRYGYRPTTIQVLMENGQPAAHSLWHRPPNSSKEAASQE